MYDYGTRYFIRVHAVLPVLPLTGRLYAIRWSGSDPSGVFYPARITCYSRCGHSTVSVNNGNIRHKRQFNSSSKDCPLDFTVMVLRIGLGCNYLYPGVSYLHTDDINMQILYFTITAVLLYVFSDWLLTRIEAARGKTLEHRSLVFLVIIMVLAVGSFKVIEILTAT